MSDSEKVLLAQNWIATWNAILTDEKTMDDLLKFYSRAVLYDSPYTKDLINSDRITNTNQLKEYFNAGLQKFQTHRLVLQRVFTADKYMTIVYIGFNDRLTSEFIMLDEQNKFLKVYVSYEAER